MLAFRRFIPAAALAISFAAAFVASAPLTVSAHPSLDIAAANWKFTPNKIEAHVGETTTLRVISSEGVHGIKSDELGIPDTKILPGRTSVVSFTPKKAGTYVLHCTVPCGQGHGDMQITIVVKD